MSRAEEFLNLFSEQEKSKTIEKLIQKFFEEELWIAEGLYFGTSRVNDLKYFVLDEAKCKNYESQFLIFGKATHTGSSYAFYKVKSSKNCDEWPIIVLGDEGGVVVLAKNLYDLMKFWTLNSVQPYVSSFGKKEFDLFNDESIDNDPELSNQAFREFIKQEFDLDLVLSIEQAKLEIINPAIELYQNEIDAIFENNN